MTTGFGIQPDSYFPTSTTNTPDPGFSAYSQKTQADYQTEQTNQMLGVLAPLTGLCNTLTANPYFAEILAIGQDVAGASGNMIVDFLNGATPYANDLLAFLGNPVGVGTGVVTGVINAVHIGALDASKIVSGTFANSFVPGLQSTWNSIVYALGGPALGNDLTDVINALNNIPADNIIGAVAGGAQEVIDAILAAANDLYVAGSGTAAEVETVFNNLFAMFADPALMNTAMSVTGAVETFITSMLAPTNLLAPLVAVGANYVVPAINIAVLDAAKITSGTFADSFVPGLAALRGTISGSQGGSGNTLTDVTTALQNIVINNVNGLTGYLTHLSPSGVLALIGLAAGALPAGITMGAAALTAGAIGAGVTIAGNAISSVIAAVNVPSLPAGWPGTIDASVLVGDIEQAAASWAAPIDTLMNAWGVAATGNTAAALGALAAAIPHGNVAGLLGGADMGNTIQNFVDAGLQGILNSPGSVNNTLAMWSTTLTSALVNFLGYTTGGAAPPGSVAAITSATNANLNNRAVQKTTYANLDKTLDATFDLSEINTAATLPTVALTQATSVAGYITARDGGIKQSVTWLGYGLANVTGFYVNLYTVNPVSGLATWIYSTANIVGSVGVGSAPVWNFVNLPAVNYINTNPGDILKIEFTITGTGTYTMVGKTLSSQLPPHPTAIPGLPGATRLYGAAAPTVDSTGNGHTTGANTPNPVSYTQNIAADANCFVMAVHYSSTGSPVFTPTVGGTAIPAIGSPFTYTAGMVVVWYVLMNPPTGTGKTVSLSYTVSGSTTMFIQTWSLKNVSAAIAAPVTASGTSAAISQTVAGTAGGPYQLLVNIMGNSAPSGSITGYTKTQDVNFPYTAGQSNATVAGHSVGATSATVFGATNSAGSANWGSAVLALAGALQPAPATDPNPGTAGSLSAYAAATPWCGLSGIAGATQYSPITTAYGTPGSVSIPNPATTYPWANWFDVLVMGGGGGGAAGGPLHGSVGGSAGVWATATLSKAQAGTAAWAAIVGDGGAGGASTSAPGLAGGGSSVTVTGYGSITSPGAAGAPATATGTATGGAGASAATLSYADHYGNTLAYAGGAGGGTGQAAGGQPGGGGAGGNSVGGFGTFIYGGNGGKGGIYIRAYQ